VSLCRCGSEEFKGATKALRQEDALRKLCDALRLRVFVAKKMNAYLDQVKKILFLLLLCNQVIAQTKVDYTIELKPTDTTRFHVTIQLSNAPANFKLAMVAHPEYDDRYWRYVEDLTINGNTTGNTITREENSLWSGQNNKPVTTIRYTIHLPPPVFRGAWQPFFNSNGALFGGQHTYMYVVGKTKIPSTVTVKIPAAWTIETALHKNAANIFSANTVAELVDAPILAGKLQLWTFNIDNIPHRVVYYRLPNQKPIDGTKLVTGIRQLVTETKKLFKSLPYSSYRFLIQDGSYGALEHADCVTLGAPVEQLKEDIAGTLSEIAHEYLHSWNLVRIKPIEFGDVVYKDPPLAKTLWFSEGFTMFYADELLRRAKLPVQDSTRLLHRQELFTQFYANKAYPVISAEKISLSANAAPDYLGDYSASTHAQGELFAIIFDIIIRKQSNNKRSLDDVMRLMMKRFSAKGFTAADVNAVLNEVCGCSFDEFFQQQIYNATGEIDINQYLSYDHQEVTVKWKDAVNEKGEPLADLRVYAYYLQNGKLAIGITDPTGAWARAGLHTGDEIIAINEQPPGTQREFFRMVGGLKYRDVVRMKVKHNNEIFDANVVVRGYRQPHVVIVKTETKE
jgi:predicted metalloprotease with PDZ domain